MHAAAVQPTDTIVEIGAGTGNLTAFLGERAKRVIAIEIDTDLIPILRDRVARFKNVEVIHADAREFDPTRYRLPVTGYSVVANIPYNITSLLIRRLLESDPSPERMILLIQKEVAQRICAQPPEMSLLSVAVQYYAEPRILFSVPRTCFSPRPNVDSAVILFSLHGRGGGVPSRRLSEGGTLESMRNGSSFFRLVHAGFAHKRKFLISNLKTVIPAKEGIKMDAIFKQLNIPLTARAQELSLEQWKELCSVLFPFTAPQKQDILPIYEER